MNKFVKLLLVVLAVGVYFFIGSIVYSYDQAFDPMEFVKCSRFGCYGEPPQILVVAVWPLWLLMFLINGMMGVFSAWTSGMFG